MAPEDSDKGRGTCPECAPPSSVVTGDATATAVAAVSAGRTVGDVGSYGGNSDSEDCSRGSSMGSAEDRCP